MTQVQPFTPIGSAPRWRLLYDVLVDTRTGDVATYARLADAIDVDPVRDRSAIQHAMQRADRELLEHDQRATEVVRGVGYRVVTPTEQIRLAQQHQKKATRALTRGHRTVTHIDYNGMADADKQRARSAGRAFAALIEWNRRLDVRQRRLEDAVATVTERTDRSEDEIRELRHRLEQLEARRRDREA